MDTGSGDGGSSGHEGLPESIGPYRILALLGRGGMGEVFLASDPRLKRRVAIKRIRQDVKFTPVQRERLLREAQAIAAISHPAIVHVNEMLEDADGNDCIVMEHVEGPTLAAALLKQGPWQPLLAVRLAREIASGLAAAHAGGIIHRDLKTENVMLTLSGHAKILDFGLAKPIVPVKGDATLTEAHCVVGTCRSMSPEQARREELDERSDLFSLGVLLYEMLAGEPPFHASSAVGTLAQVLSHHPPRVNTLQPEVPQRLSTLVARLLEKDPACRPQNAEEVIHELGMIEDASGPPLFPSSDETISELPTGFYTPPSSAGSVPVPRSVVALESTQGMSVPKRRWRLETAVLAVLVAAILGIGLAFFLPRHRSQPPSPSLRVRVLKPQTNSQDERSLLAALSILTTCLNTLNSLKGVEAIDDTQLVVPTEARVGVLDELLVATFAEEGTRWKVTLRRQQPDGQPGPTKPVTGTSEAEDLVGLSELVRKSLLAAYPGRASSGVPLSALNENYAIFLAIKKRLDTKSALSQEDQIRLRQVADKSPYLLDARLLSAEIQLTTYQTTHNVDYLSDALALVQGATFLAPNDNRRLISQFKIELEKDGVAVGGRRLREIEQHLSPDSPRALVLRASLEDKNNRPQSALAYAQKAADFSPTWRNVYSLAKFEEQTGHIQDARSHLRKILQIFPDNLRVLERLANLELGYGDPKLAEQLFQKLVDPKQQHGPFNNIGVAQLLLRQYRDAIKSFRKALETDKNQAFGNLDLGEAELAQGWRARANQHFLKALDEIDKNQTTAGLSPFDRMVKAQCLAHLGNKVDAEEIARGALQQTSDSAESLRYAAQIYAEVGDWTSAVGMARKARQKGVAPNWFRLPVFDPLRNDPAFRKLIDNPPGAPLDGEPPAAPAQ
jgi:serine/threonine protein kinase/tetratricopeptide (TPR) repeat protein